MPSSTGGGNLEGEGNPYVRELRGAVSAISKEDCAVRAQVSVRGRGRCTYIREINKFVWVWLAYVNDGFQIQCGGFWCSEVWSVFSPILSAVGHVAVFDVS